VGWTTEGETLAEDIRVKYPIRGDALLSTVNESNGAVIAIDEDDIITGRDELAECGLYVEPSSAIVWSALHQVIAELEDPVVVILTATGS
jgi:threonine synthase